MKKNVKLFLATTLTMIFAVQAYAQSNAASDQASQKQTTAKSTSGNFIDKDNNGVCDNFESRSGNGRGANFVDKNGDGICDNRANAGKKSGNQYRNGQGNQHRHGQGQGRGCRNYCRR